MNVIFTAIDSDGEKLYEHAEHVTDWREACARGMTYRNALVGDGIRVTWVKA